MSEWVSEMKWNWAYACDYHVIIHKYKIYGFISNKTQRTAQQYMPTNFTRLFCFCLLIHALSLLFVPPPLSLCLYIHFIPGHFPLNFFIQGNHSVAHTSRPILAIQYNRCVRVFFFFHFALAHFIWTCSFYLSIWIVLFCFVSCVIFLLFVRSSSSAVVRAFCYCYCYLLPCLFAILIYRASAAVVVAAAATATHFIFTSSLTRRSMPIFIIGVLIHTQQQHTSIFVLTTRIRHAIATQNIDWGVVDGFYFRCSS